MESETQKYTLEQVKALFESAKRKRDVHVSQLEESFDWAMPDRPFNREPDQVNPRRVVRDTTALNSARNLNANIMRLLIPRNAPWFELTYKTEKLKKKYGPLLDGKLRDTNAQLFNDLTRSQFYTVTSAISYDAIIGGTMAIGFVQEKGKVDFVEVPLDQLFILENAYGMVDTIFRRHKLTGRQLLQRFPEAKPDVLEKWTNAKHGYHEIVECALPLDVGYSHRVYTCENWTRLTKPSEEFAQRCPFVVSRWSKVAGLTWGASPVRNAMGSIRTANNLMKLILAHGEYAAFGLFQVQGSVMNFENLGGKGGLKPGSVLNVDEPLQPVAFPGQFQISLQLLESQQRIIRSHMLDSTPPSDDKLKYMTATAITTLREEFYNQIGEPAERYQREYLQPVAEQYVYRSFKEGKIDLLSNDDIRKLGDPEITSIFDLFQVDVTAALAKVNAAQQANDAFNSIARNAQVYGLQAIAEQVDIESALPDMLVGMGLPRNYILTPQQKKKLQADKAAFAQRGQMLSGQLAAANQPVQPEGAPVPEATEMMQAA